PGMSDPRHEILSAYTEGAMDVPRRLLLEVHLSKCPTCSIRAAEDHGLESLPDATLRDVLEAPSQRTNDLSEIVCRFRGRSQPSSKLLPSAAGVTGKSGFMSATAAPIAASSAASSRPGSWWNGIRCLTPASRAKASASCIALCPQPTCRGYSSRVYCA